MAKNPEVCTLLDVLTLEMLDLIQQQVQCKMNIERQKHEGEILLAEGRYIQGLSSISSAQLPTENTAEFHALARVSCRKDENFEAPEFAVERSAIDRNAGFVNPLNWFGVLVPRCVQAARTKFEKAVELVVEAANVQSQLRKCICYIVALRKIKSKNVE